MTESDKKPWRTNIGLRLTAEDGKWFEQYCLNENRSMANFVELLIKRERKRVRGKK